MQYPKTIYIATIDGFNPSGTKYFYTKNSAIVWICSVLMTSNSLNITEVLKTLLETNEYIVYNDNHLPQLECWIDETEIAE